MRLKAFKIKGYRMIPYSMIKKFRSLLNLQHISGPKNYETLFYITLTFTLGIFQLNAIVVLYNHQIIKQMNAIN